VAEATVEVTRQDHSITTFSRHIYMGVILRAHLVRVELHIQRNANREVAIVAKRPGKWENSVKT